MLGKRLGMRRSCSKVAHHWRRKSAEALKLTRYRRMARQLAHLMAEGPLLCLGTVLAMPPGTARCVRETYRWTRKVKAKTVTECLSREQYLAFKKAIAANRKVESLLAQMRDYTMRTLLENLPSVKRKPRRNNSVGAQ
jgi:hypothetical protein